MKSETKICQNCKKDFTIEPEDFNFYEKVKVPPPTFCPECRMKRRMAWRNERNLFRQKDLLTGENIISTIPPDSGHVVMNETDWWAQEKWNPLSYGREFDPNKPFLLQLYDLFKEVPRFRINAVRMINSEYSGNATNLKNCYLLFNSNYSEDSAYGNAIDYSKNCYDNSHVKKSEKCYESFWLTNCYDTHFSVQCEDCVSVWFSKNCRGLTNCFGCVNLTNKSYCIFNEQFSKDEYGKRLKNMNLDRWSSISELKKKVKEFWLKFPNKFMQGVKNIDVSGEYITHSKSVKKSYLIRESRDLKYVQYSQVPSSFDCMDCTVIGSKSELFYEGAICGWGGSNLKFCAECWDGGRDLEYSLFCGRLAVNLFGCVGIMKQQYCILNKQYTKEDFFTLREKIIKNMNEMPYVDKKGRVYKYGEFFPPEFSPFAYNQTILIDHFLSNKEEAEKLGMRFTEPNNSEYEITTKYKDLPDSIKDVQESITKEIINCSNCDRAYRIMPSELIFLKNVNLPLPRFCVDCRHHTRILNRNKSKIYKRVCDCNGINDSSNKYKNTLMHQHINNKCNTEFETSYSTDRPEIVYCEKCYQQEVY